MNKDLYEYLLKFVTDNKKQRIEEVLKTRTRHLTIAIEDVYLPQNASAVVRSCDCFGVQDIHIIENNNKYKGNPQVSLGASKWVNVIKYHLPKENNTIACINALRSKGYKIIAATPHSNDVNLEELPVGEKMALFFGNEREGLSQDVIKNADHFMKIPMSGFTESLNISVSAAISIHSIMSRLWKSDINWMLTEEEKQELRYNWVKKNVNRLSILEKEFWKTAPKNDKP